MKIFYIIISLLVLIFIFLLFWPRSVNNNLDSMDYSKEIIKLKEVKLEGQLSLEEVLAKRRSIRDYSDKSLSDEQISQILWSAQGISDQNQGLRTTPSAGALYPLELYIVVNRASEYLDVGVYKYQPESHALIKTKDGQVKEELSRAALGQTSVSQAALTLVITAVYQRTKIKYGDRAYRYVHMEAGHAAQNVYLQVTALDLGTVVIGAFNDQAVKEILGLAKDEEVLYLMPIGQLF